MRNMETQIQICFSGSVKQPDATGINTGCYITAADPPVWHCWTLILTCFGLPEIGVRQLFICMSSLTVLA